VRYRTPDGEKTYPQYHLEGGQWVKGKPQGPKIPYRLPELLDYDRTEPVWIFEGEKCADIARRHGLQATSASEGAGKWTADLNEYFADRIVGIVPDADQQGRDHAAKVAAYLHGVAKEVRIIDLPVSDNRGPITVNNDGEAVDVPTIKAGEDVEQFLTVSGGSVEHLQLLSETAPIWQPRPNGGGIGQDQDGLRENITPGAGHNSGLGEWDAGDNPGPIPPREWLLGNQFCRKFISSIVATGGTGKSALRLLQFISLALGRPLTGQHVFRRCRVLLISLEDDMWEMQRRIDAVLKHYKIDRGELKGWLFCATPKLVKLAEITDKGRTLGPLEQWMRDAIKRRGPDIASLDPFVKTHGLEENSSNDMDFVCDLLARMSIEHNIAVDSPHHTRKGSNTPGDADAGRGSSGIKDAGRLVFTLTPMSSEEAAMYGVPEDDKSLYVRLDSAKVNIIRRGGKPLWFRLVGVRLDNGTQEYPNGDEVQTVEPWTPPNTFEGLADAVLNAALTEIDKGMTNGQRYSGSGAAKERAAWPVVQKHCPTKTEVQCRQIINAWVRTKLLFDKEYDDPIERKKRKGLHVDDARRPGTAT
jgi:hypothetical protein